MIEIITLTGAIIDGEEKPVGNPAVEKTVIKVLSWVGNALGGSYLSRKNSKRLSAAK